MAQRAGIFAGGFLLLGAALVLAQAPDGVQVGKNVPGSFQPFNINVASPIREEPEEDPKIKGPKPLPYSSLGKFHCLVTEYDLDPVVLLVARGIEDNAAFRALLIKLDAAMDRNKTSRLRCFVVFLAKEFNVIEDDDKRDEIVKRLEKLVDDTKVKRVVVTLAGEKDLAKYKLDETMALTAILYKKLRVEAIHLVPTDKLDAETDPAIKAILTDMGTKLGAKR